MADWKQHLAASFGSLDGKFALYSADRDQARKMLAAAFEAGVRMPEIEAEVRRHLARFPLEHTAAQLERVRQVATYLPEGGA